MTGPRRALRVAVEGCGHGTLDAIYASTKKACEVKGWDGVDLLIIGGDFQAARNAADMNTMAMPKKYRTMADFHRYYSGERTAPYLTIFVGGNHEVSNYLQELSYGGWVAPNIYFVGNANVLRIAGLRIAGMSGIWKGYNYKKPHFERLPFNETEMRSIYHVREVDVRKLLRVREPVDIGISHDWPRGVEWHGDWAHLFRKKDQFEQESRDGTLGSVAAEQVLDRIRPRYWFSAHLHVKFAAIVQHQPGVASLGARWNKQAPVEEPKPGPVAEPAKNADEIDLDLGDDDTAPAQGNPVEIDRDMDDAEPKAEPSAAPTTVDDPDAVPDSIRDELPAAFRRDPQLVRQEKPREWSPPPPEVSNPATHFLALDKCLPGRHFLQLLEVPTSEGIAEDVKPRLEYDPEWLAIFKAMAFENSVGDGAEVPPSLGSAAYYEHIDESRKWVSDHLGTAQLYVPENFCVTAPAYDPSLGERTDDMPREHTNPQTAAFCEMLEIENIFDATEEEREERYRRGPRPDDDNRGGNRGWSRGRGGFDRSRGRGGRGRGGGGFGRGGGRGNRGGGGWRGRSRGGY